MSLHLPLSLSSLLLATLLAEGTLLKLPDPPAGGVALSQALKARRSTRAFAPGGPSLSQAAAILWAAQGVNRPDGRRTVPSAGATYPLEVYLLTEGSKDLPKGTYKYLPKTHQIQKLSDRGPSGRLQEVSRQDWVRSTPAVVVVAAVTSRTSARYGDRATRYVHMEVGACAQNLALQAVALGLGSTLVGAFDDEALKRALALPAEESPLLLIPFGHPRE